jgi:hypothetical protein
MSSNRSYDPITRRRGTRGFAAIVTGLAGVVAVTAALAPAGSGAVDPTLRSWIVILTIAFGIAHLVAVGGLLRARPWSARLVGYLAAIGVGAAAYVVLVTVTGLDPFGSTSALPAGQARAEGVGLAIWTAGTWLVAARFAFRGFPPARPVVAGPSPSARILAHAG